MLCKHVWVKSHRVRFSRTLWWEAFFSPDWNVPFRCFCWLWSGICVIASAWARPVFLERLGGIPWRWIYFMFTASLLISMYRACTFKDIFASCTPIPARLRNEINVFLFFLFFSTQLPQCKRNSRGLDLPLCIDKVGWRKVSHTSVPKKGYWQLLLQSLVYVGLLIAIHVCMLWQESELDLTSYINLTESPLSYLRWKYQASLIFSKSL